MPGIVLHGHDQASTTASLPTNAEIGQTVYDTVVGALRVWNGSSWQMMTVVPTQAATFVTTPIANCTGNVNDLTGGDANYLLFTAGGVKNNFYTTRTAAQLFGDIAGCVAGFACQITIMVLPTAAPVTLFPGSGVELNVIGQGPTQSLVIAPGASRNLCLTFNSSTVATLQAVGSGTWP